MLTEGAIQKSEAIGDKKPYMGLTGLTSHAPSHATTLYRLNGGHKVSDMTPPA